MTNLLARDGTWLSFPPLPLKNSIDVIEAPPDDVLGAIAERIAPENVLRSANSLIRNAHKRRHNQRWRHVSRSKVLLANLLLERAVREGLF